jgi:hypothetical protein
LIKQLFKIYIAVHKKRLTYIEPDSMLAKKWEKALWKVKRGREWKKNGKWEMEKDDQHGDFPGGPPPEY